MNFKCLHGRLSKYSRIIQVRNGNTMYVCHYWMRSFQLGFGLSTSNKHRLILFRIYHFEFMYSNWRVLFFVLLFYSYTWCSVICMEEAYSAHNRLFCFTNLRYLYYFRKKALKISAVFGSRGLLPTGLWLESYILEFPHANTQRMIGIYVGGIFKKSL